MKAVSLFKFTKDSEFKIKEMLQEDVLSQHKFSPCGDLDKRKIGFVKNITSDTFVDEIHVEGDSFHVMTIREQKKNPEKYLIDEYVASKKVQYLAETDGKEPEKAVIKEWKEEGTDLYLRTTHPKKPVDFKVMVRNDGVIFVEAKGAQSESLLSLVRKAVGTFPVIPFVEDFTSVSDYLDNLVLKSVSDELTLGNQVELIDAEEIKHSITKGSVYESDAASYVEDGMIVSKLALTHDGVVSFVLDENLLFDKISFDKELTDGEGNEAGDFFIKLDEFNKAVKLIVSRTVDKPTDK